MSEGLAFGTAWCPAHWRLEPIEEAMRDHAMAVAAREGTCPGGKGAGAHPAHKTRIAASPLGTGQYLVRLVCGAYVRVVMVGAEVVT